MSTNEEDISYVREAFLNTWNLVFLSILSFTGVVLASYTPPVFYMALTAFGVLSESIYLGVMSNHERFRRHIRSQKRSPDERDLKRKEIYKELSQYAQKRYYKLHKIKNEIQTNYKKLDYTSQGVLNSHIEKIEEILDSYLRLLHQKEHNKNLADDNTEEEINASIEELKEDMEDDSERVRRMKKKRLNVLERRASRFEHAKENLEIIETQLGTIEDALMYIQEESWSLQDPEEVSFELDNLLSRVDETQEVLHTGIGGSSVDSELRALDEELQSSTEEDLDLDETGSTQKSRVRG